MLKNAKGIDVSYHQGKIDWEKVTADGIEFAIIRAGFGNSASQKDDRFDANIKEALSARLPVGIYWFSYAVDAKDALKEAEACNSVLKPWKGKLTLPVFFDFEYASETYNKKVTYTRQSRTDIIRAFCEAMKGYGYKVGYYTNKDYIQNRIDKARLPYDLWLADYSGSPDYTCAIQQTSSTGKVGGISGNVDTDTCFTEYEEAETVPEKPEAAPKFRVGDKVKVKKAEVYGGGSFTAYADTYEVIQVSGDRVVIGLDGIVTAAVHEKNLAKISSSGDSGPSSSTSIEKGDTVKVLKNQVYGGGSFKVYYDTYEVMQVSGDRAVIGVNNVVTAAVHVKNLQKV